MFPIFVFMFMSVVQWGLYWHAQSTITAAAQDAARVAQAYNGTVEAGHDVAMALLARPIESGLVEQVTIDVTREDGVVRAEVTGMARQLVPLPMNMQIVGVAEGPIEAFIAEDQR